MKSNPRDKWLLICLPAIFTAIVYSWGFARKNSVALSEARKQLQAVSDQPDAQAALMRKTQELSRLEDQYENYAERKNAARAVPGVPHSGANRAAALKVLAAAADKSNLVLLQSSALSEASKLKEVAAISKGIDLPAPQLWRLELAGSYLNMLKMLTELKKAETFVVPLEVKMEPLKDETDSPGQKWTLTVWI
ncbi:MAG TPA: hypothetical protein VEK08_03065 [Planctomycetota bacterium]|nr:hypothetical protein [Planctomycetota bacterium]